MLLDTNSLLLCAYVEGQGGMGGGEESNLIEAKIKCRKDSKKKKKIGEILIFYSKAVRGHIHLLTYHWRLFFLGN